MEEAQTTFEGLKRYLTSPSVLVASNLGEPLLLYNATTMKVISMVLVVECDETRANSSESHATKDETTVLDIARAPKDQVAERFETRLPDASGPNPLPGPPEA
jgi:hypothetical protein